MASFTSLTLSFLLLVPTLALAQPELHSGSKGVKPALNPTATAVDSDTNALDVNVVNGAAPAPSTAACKKVTVNAQGAAGAAITIDNTVGGVTVLAASTTRCGAIVTNAGSADMNCSPSTQTPSATVGQRVTVGMTLVLGLEGQEAWKCFRTTSTSTSVTVSEATP